MYSSRGHIRTSTLNGCCMCTKVYIRSECTIEKEGDLALSPANTCSRPCLSVSLTLCIVKSSNDWSIYVYQYSVIFHVCSKFQSLTLLSINVYMAFEFDWNMSAFLTLFGLENRYLSRISFQICLLHTMERNLYGYSVFFILWTCSSDETTKI